MALDVKRFLRFAGLVGAISSVTGGAFAAISYARPLLDSDWPGPFASQTRVEARVAACDAKVVKLAQNFTLMQENQQRTNQTQLFLAQGFWVQQQAMAEVRLRTHPNDADAMARKIQAQQQLDQIRRLIQRQ